MTVQRGPNYVIEVTRSFEDLTPETEHVEVHVHFVDGTACFGTFFTPAHVRYLFEIFRRTGEHCGGLYVSAPGMVVVRELTPDAIAATVACMIEHKQLEYVFVQDTDESEDGSGQAWHNPG